MMRGLWPAHHRLALPSNRQEMIARERRERQASVGRRDPDGLLDLGSGRDGKIRTKQVGADVETCGLDDVLRLVCSLRGEFAEILRRVGRDADAEFLLKLAGERMRRTFVWLDFATGLHEGLCAA